MRNVMVMDGSLHFDLANCFCDPHATSIFVTVMKQSPLSIRAISRALTGRSGWEKNLFDKVRQLSFSHFFWFAAHNVVHADKVDQSARRRKGSHTHTIGLASQMMIDVPHEHSRSVQAGAQRSDLTADSEVVK